MIYLLNNNFNNWVYGGQFSVQEIVSFDLIVKANVGLERDGQTNLHVITEIILMQFYDLHGNLMI